MLWLISVRMENWMLERGRWWGKRIPVWWLRFASRIMQTGTRVVLQLATRPVVKAKFDTLSSTPAALPLLPFRVP